MKSKIGIVVLLAFVFSSCSKEKNVDEAILLLTEARTNYYSGNSSQAYLLLDSLKLAYPQAYTANNLGEYLRDSIVRSESTIQIDLLSDEINDFRREILLLRGQDEEKAAFYKTQIDSLEQEREPLRKAVLKIYRDELSRCPQCVLQMREVMN